MMRTANYPESVVIPSDARCWSEINLGALRSNLEGLISQHPEKRIIPIVKADAYGHGIAAVAPVLAESGAAMLAVANLGEARQLLENGYRGETLLLSPLLPDERDRLFQLDPTPVLTVASAPELLFWEQVARESGRIVRAHLKIDTGMGRIGQWHEAVDELRIPLQKLEALQLVGAYTHFSCAENDFSWTTTQTRRFKAALAALGLDSPRPDFWIHGENSAALCNRSSSAEMFNAARIGIACYGVSPVSPSSTKAPHHSLLEPVLALRARIISVKSLPAGTPISYGAIHRLRRPSTVGVLGAGYAEGLSLGLSDRGQVLVDGVRCPILGRVTMDQIIIDLTDHPASIHAGMVATLIGGSGGDCLTVHEHASAAGTIPWQVLCCLTARVWRCYFDPKRA